MSSDKVEEIREQHKYGSNHGNNYSLADCEAHIAVLLAEVERLQMVNTQLTALAKKCGYDVVSIQELFGAE